jgi:serine/threonine protein kinase
LLGTQSISGHPTWLVLYEDEVNTDHAREEIQCAFDLVETKRPGINERISNLKIDFSSLKLNKKVGNGSFGEVYRAVLGDTHIVAVKRIPRDEVSSVKVASMLTEIDVLASCSHPNITQLIGWSDDPYVLVCFEYANGGSLKDYLKSSTKLQVGWNYDKTKIAMDAAAGLAYLHNRGILHRDIKADNLLVFCVGENSIVVKLGDFGSSRSSEPQNVEMTLVGSSLWLAPEISCGERDYSFPADVWSFGVCLCEIATHSVPYEDLKTRESFFNQIGVAQGRISPAEQLTSASDLLSRNGGSNFSNLQRLVEKCCGFRQEERPSMNIVRFELYQMMSVDESAIEIGTELSGNDEKDISVRRINSLTLPRRALSDHADSDSLGPLHSPMMSAKNADLRRISDPTSAKKRSNKNMMSIGSSSKSILSGI